MKRGKLSVVEKFYIESHKDQPVSELSKLLERSETTISKYLDTLKPEQIIEKPKKRLSGTMDMMRDPKNPGRGVVVMTQAASERFDESPKATGHNRHSKSIMKIYEE